MMNADEIQVLDRGFVRLVEVMGGDSAVVQAARVSYGPGTKTVREDEKLIAYLIEHEHWTPFEMAVLKVHVKAPIFVARQWFRHRAGSFNELSARYSEVEEAFYVPEVFRSQGKQNKQGSGGAVPFQALCMRTLYNASKIAFDTYEELIDLGVAREQARMVLPLNTYTEWYWKVDLRNLLHFLRLRLDEAAQWEIRQYAEALAEIVAKWVPATYAAWGKKWST